ncbi:hypothetical protein C1646_778122 [Rhizophagus diaphanus]|nr:hypothetical protein C1646_778122 [Rhizophagus diaphanus] [Rhizophagus sp. MUCL 43196]
MDSNEELSFIGVYLASVVISFLPLYCKKYAKFDAEELLDEFLRERFKQKLVYNFYKKEFAMFEYERDSEKILEGHIEALCEKCKLLRRHCGSESSY